MHGCSGRSGCFMGGHRSLLQGTFLNPGHVEGIKSRFCVWDVVFWSCLVGSGFYAVPFSI